MHTVAGWGQGPSGEGVRRPPFRAGSAGDCCAALGQASPSPGFSALKYHLLSFLLCVIHSMIQDIFKPLGCARHCYLCWGFSNEQSQQPPPPTFTAHSKQIRGHRLDLGAKAKNVNAGKGVRDRAFCGRVTSESRPKWVRERAWMSGGSRREGPLSVCNLLASIPSMPPTSRLPAASRGLPAPTAVPTAFAPSVARATL